MSRPLPQPAARTPTAFVDNLRDGDQIVLYGRHVYVHGSTRADGYTSACWLLFSEEPGDDILRSLHQCMELVEIVRFLRPVKVECPRCGRRWTRIHDCATGKPRSAECRRCAKGRAGDA